MPLISQRTLGRPDPSRRLTPGQEQLLTLASALGTRLKFKVADLSDKIMAENMGSLLMRGLVTMRQVPFTRDEEREFQRMIAKAGPGRDQPEAPIPPELKAAADARVSICLEVTPAGEEYMRKPPTGRARFDWWRRLPHPTQTRLMVLGAVAAIYLAGSWLKRFF